MEIMRKTIEQLARDNGEEAKPNTRDDARYSPWHLAADVLNGWSRHAARNGAVELTDDEYRSAIKAAKSGKTYGPANLRGK
jgi:hypothetical protein